MKEAKSYEDSAEFAKAFKEIYPLIKPKESIKELADRYYSRVSRGFTKLDMDSAAMYQTAINNLDTNADQALLFDAYRKHLTAKELTAYIAFLKTVEGKKVVEAFPQLERAKTESNGYVSRTINTNIAPLRQKQNELMRKEMPPRDSVKGPDGTMIPRPRTEIELEKAMLRDSIMKARKLDRRKNDDD